MQPEPADPWCLHLLLDSGFLNIITRGTDTKVILLLSISIHFILMYVKFVKFLKV